VIHYIDVLEQPMTQRPRKPRNGIGMNARAGQGNFSPP
jgi:hypothetical protein